MTDAKPFEGIECQACGRVFEDLPAFRGHVRWPDGALLPEACPGGR